MSNEENLERQPCFMRKDLYEELKNLATINGMSIYRYTNELLSAAIDIEKNGIRLGLAKDQIIFLSKLIQNYKGTVILVPFVTYRNTDAKSWKELGKAIMAYIYQFSQEKRVTFMSILYLFLSFIADVNINSTFTILEARSPFLSDDKLQNIISEMIEGIKEVTDFNIYVEKTYGMIKIRIEEKR